MAESWAYSRATIISLAASDIFDTSKPDWIVGNAWVAIIPRISKKIRISIKVKPFGN